MMLQTKYNRRQDFFFLIHTVQSSHKLFTDIFFRAHISETFLVQLAYIDFVNHNNIFRCNVLSGWKCLDQKGLWPIDHIIGPSFIQEKIWKKLFSPDISLKPLNWFLWTLLLMSLLTSYIIFLFKLFWGSPYITMDFFPVI